MIKTYKNIDMNKPMQSEEYKPIVGMKIKELVSGRIAKITGVYDEDNEVWMVSGNDIGVVSLSDFWKFFEEVQS